MLREWRLPFSYTRAKKASSGLEVNSRVRCVADAAPAFTAFEGQRDDQLLCSFLFLHLRRLRRPFSCQSFLRQPIDNIKGSLNIKLFGLFWPLVQVTRKLAKNPLNLALFAGAKSLADSSSFMTMQDLILTKKRMKKSSLPFCTCWHSISKFSYSACCK